jgi:Dyp-type peroxidase family
VVQFDLDAADLDGCERQLAAAGALLRELGFAAGFQQPGDQATYLFGMSARLLKGPWTPWRDDDDFSARWQRRVTCPESLRSMQAKRDNEFPAFRTEQQRNAHETDIVALLESADHLALDDAATRLGKLLGTTVRVHHGALRPQGRDPFGFHDGVSNLQDLRANDRRAYTGHLIHQVPGVEVEGTFLAFRKYRLFPRRMGHGAPLEIVDERGDPTRRRTPEEIVGRCRSCGAVLDRDTGEHLAARTDEQQGGSAHPQSHLHKANPRGTGYTNFGHHVVVPDARILRRSYPVSAGADSDVDSGLLFLAFQANIQQSGFEFIHNEWLLSDFNGAPDPLLSPEAGLVEPLTGCYYFIPRDQGGCADVLRTLVATEPPDEWEDEDDD